MWKFAPIYKETIWGGCRIAALKGHTSPSPCVGEAWELSSLPMWETVVADGPDKGKTLRELCREYGDEFMGRSVRSRYGDRFPLLVKFIDATADLSVQVHPDDEGARRHGYPNGKNEMWYVVEAEPGARIADGFREPVSPEEFARIVESGDIESRLNYVDVSVGDAYYVPAGSVHALGAGTMVVEVQQTSDTTYRIYDYGRRDNAGAPRPLHAELARDVIDFGRRGGIPIPYVEKEDGVSPIVSTPYFNVSLVMVSEEMRLDFSAVDSFVILVGVAGRCRVRSGKDERALCCGETLLFPASSSGVEIIPEDDFRALEVYVEECPGAPDAPGSEGID